MGTLYIDRQNASLSYESGVLSVKIPDEMAKRYPCRLLERVVLRSEVALTSRVITGLAEHGCNLIVMGGRSGQQVAQITGTPHADARRRWSQILQFNDPGVARRVAGAIVRTKIRRQLRVVESMQAARPDLHKPFFDARQRLLESLGAERPDSLSLEAIRGVEGAAAAAYFGAYFKAFAPALNATGRSRRPPKDPVNAVLSLAYTLLHAQAVSICHQVGLDPAFGTLHTPSHGRAALACDLMEPFRPSVDVWVWQLFREGEIRPEHFGTEAASGACLLGKAGRSHFYRAWESFEEPLRRQMLLYTRQLARQMGGGVTDLQED